MVGELGLPGFATCCLTAGKQTSARKAEAAGQPSALSLAKALLAQSSLRQGLFDGLFRQPAWDMLLFLYVAMREQAELTERAVCASSGEPFGAASGRLRKMEQEGLITRRRGRHAACETVIEITDEAASAVEGLLWDLAAGIHPSTCGAERTRCH